jgi:cobalt-zinc-cadmium efflux system protein
VVIAGLIYLKTGWQWLDPAISIAIAVIVLWSSFGLLQESMHLSLDAVPKNIDVEKVHSFLLRLDGVKDVHDLHIWPLSTSRTALTAHVVMHGEHPGNALMQEIAEELEAHFDIAHSTIQIEVGSRSSEQS